MVLGEDPGLLASVSNSSGLILNVGWLLAGVGWSAWQLWTAARWRGSWVEVGLLATVGCVLLSAAIAASYKHPAWLITWEWFILLVAFCLVRQLTRNPGDNRGLLAALLATGVTISAYAVFQYTVEFPEARASLANRAQLRRELAAIDVFVETDPAKLWPDDVVGLLAAFPAQPFPSGIPWGAVLMCAEPDASEEDIDLARWEERIQMAHVFGTYSHPNSFAGFLALLLPAALGVAVVCWRQGADRHRAWSLLAAGCAGLIACALWLTHSRGAVLGVVAAGVSVGCLLARSFLQRQKMLVAVLLVASIALAWFAWQQGWVSAAFGKDTQTSARRLDYWTATWKLITDHPWLGVGPGNFGRFYPRYMVPSAFEKLKDPHNFVLEMWANSGVFSALALLATLGILFWKLWRATAVEPKTLEAGLPAPNQGLRWEFYLGGVAGLLVGFVLRAGTMAPEVIPLEGLLAGGRSIAWFTAFAVIDSVLWRGSSRPLVLGAGVLALLINLLVSAGIALPSVAQPLWIMAALALNTAGVGETAVSRAADNSTSWLWRFLPLPALAGAWLAYVGFIFSPITSAENSARDARRHYLEWVQKVEPDWRARYQKTAKDDVRRRVSLAANEFLETRIIRKLEAAVDTDPGNVRWLTELSHWTGERWKLLAALERIEDGPMKYADRACRLDPEGKEGYQARSRLYRTFAQAAQKSATPAVAPQLYGKAAAALHEAVKRDPAEPRIHYQHAELLFLAGEAVEGRAAALTALQLDTQPTDAGRRLTDRQHRQIQRWLQQAPTR
jgi:hypothetical protein